MAAPKTCVTPTLGDLYALKTIEGIAFWGAAITSASAMAARLWAFWRLIVGQM